MYFFLCLQQVSWRSSPWRWEWWPLKGAKVTATWQSARMDFYTERWVLAALVPLFNFGSFSCSVKAERTHFSLTAWVQSGPNSLKGRRWDFQRNRLSVRALLPASLLRSIQSRKHDPSVSLFCVGPCGNSGPCFKDLIFSVALWNHTADEMTHADQKKGHFVAQPETEFPWRLLHGATEAKWCRLVKSWHSITLDGFKQWLLSSMVINWNLCLIALPDKGLRLPLACSVCISEDSIKIFYFTNIV